MLDMGKGYCFNPSSGHITTQGQIVITITGIKGVILAKLLEEGKDQCITKKQLSISIWGKDEVSIMGQSLSQQIYLLRKDLKKIGFNNYIISLSKNGYHLNTEYFNEKQINSTSGHLSEVLKRDKEKIHTYLILTLVLIILLIEIHIEIYLSH